MSSSCILTKEMIETLAELEDLIKNQETKSLKFEDSEKESLTTKILEKMLSEK